MPTRAQWRARPGRPSLRRRCPALHRRVLARDAHTCVYCSAPATQLDHLTPRARGGRDTARNLVAACARCNLRRRATPLPAWLRTLGHPLSAAQIRSRARRRLP